MIPKPQKAMELARWYDENDEIIAVTVENYLDFVNKQDKTKIADFLYHRLHCRYLKPFLYPKSDFKKRYKNGFSILANCCLLIETIQSFKNGWGDSERKSGEAFNQFFKTENNFEMFRSRAPEFYKNVRCGILHQGETMGGWRINRMNETIFNSDTLVIDSVTFAEELEKSLKKYCDTLKTEKWDSEIWDNFRTKMRKIIFNCEKKI